MEQTLHATHLLKLLDKMCKYEKDLMSIVEDTEQTRFCPQMDRRPDGWTYRRPDGQGETSIPRFQLPWSGGYNNVQLGGKGETVQYESTPKQNANQVHNSWDVLYSHAGVPFNEWSFYRSWHSMENLF